MMLPQESHLMVTEPNTNWGLLWREFGDRVQVTAQEFKREIILDYPVRPKGITGAWQSKKKRWTWRIEEHRSKRLAQWERFRLLLLARALKPKTGSHHPSCAGCLEKLVATPGCQEMGPCPVTAENWMPPAWTRLGGHSSQGLQTRPQTCLHLDFGLWGRPKASQRTG